MKVFLIIAGVFSYIAIAAIVYACIAEWDDEEGAMMAGICWPLSLVLIAVFVAMRLQVWLGGKLRNWYKERKETHHEN